MTKKHHASNHAAATQQALALLQQGRTEMALATLNRLVQSGVRSAEVWALLSSAHGARGEYAEAEQCARKALRLDPNHPWANANFGSALLKQGRYEEAIASLETAVRLAPGFAEAWSNLGIALNHSGRHEEAWAACRKAIALMPGLAAAWNNLTLILLDTDQPFAAIDCARQTLRFAPNSAEAHFNLAMGLMRVGEHDEARAHLQQTMALNPRHRRAPLLLAAQMSREDPKEYAALRAMLTATDSGDSTAEAIAFLDANQLEYEGKQQEALARIAHLLDAGTDNPYLLSLYGDIAHGLRDTAQQDRAIALLESRLAGGPRLHAEARMRLHFALGDLYDKRGDAGRAFAHYAQGNALRPVRGGLADESQVSDKRIAAWTPERYARLPASGNDTETPVFIVGMPRSGTTLVEQILDSHPAVHGAGELRDLGNLVSNLPARLGVATLAEALDRCTAETMATLAKEYLDGLVARAPQALRITDKMPHNFLHLGLIAKLYPRARIIHCTRDPVDTCLSCYFQNFRRRHDYSYDLRRLGAHYVAYRRLMRHWTETLGIAVFEVPYEEMIADQEGTTRRLIEYCGLEWDERCLAFHANPRHARTASYQQVRQPIYRSSSGKWKRYEPFIGPLLEALGMNTGGTGAA